MKQLKFLFFVIAVTLLIQQNQAYIPNKDVLVDKDLDFSNTTLFPTSCNALNCAICCGGIPPSCSEDELTCDLKENPDFSDLMLLLTFLIVFIFGNSFMTCLFSKRSAHFHCCIQLRYNE